MIAGIFKSHYFICQVSAKSSVLSREVSGRTFFLQILGRFALINAWVKFITISLTLLMNRALAYYVTSLNIIYNNII